MNALVPMELLSGTTPLESLLYLLVAGHLVGDFLFQSRWMVEHKKEARGLVAHAVEVTVAHIVVLAPFLNVSVLGVILGVGVVHLAIDWVKPHWRWDRPGPLALFFLDQAAHLVVLTGAYLLLLRLGPPPIHLEMEALHVWTLVATTGAVLAVNWTGGAVVVEMVLHGLEPESVPDEASPERFRHGASGRIVGKLERLVGLILVVLGQWVALTVLVAAKSLARYDGPGEGATTGRYLAGTFTSLVVAVVLGLGLAGLY